MVHAVFVIRHGMRADFEDPGWTTRSPRPWDPPLSPSGVRMAQETAEALAGAGIQRIFTSPFLRAVQTSHTLAQKCGAPVFVEPGFMEFLLPQYMPWAPDFLPMEELRRHCPSIDPLWEPRVVPRWPEFHENLWGAERVRRTLDGIGLDGEGPVAIVTHGAITHNSAFALTGVRAGVNIGLCAITTLVRVAGGWRLQSSNQDHLSEREHALRFS